MQEGRMFIKNNITETWLSPITGTSIEGLQMPYMLELIASDILPP